jgi:4-hydroxybenzoate polyprenyltransferase
MKNYLSLIKFSHTVFALPFAIIGFFLGTVHSENTTDWLLFLKVLLCMVFARTSAMAFNRYADRHVDGRNDRTSSREIPSGKLTQSSVLLLVMLSAFAFSAVTYTINTLCFLLSPVALAVILGYSYTKRFTWLCHLILGVGLSLAPIGAYLAVTGQFAVTPILLSLAVITWVGGFDIIYAMQDESFDREQQLYSIPSVFGGRKALIVSALLHVTTVIFLVAVGVREHSDGFYWTGTAFFVLLLFRQHRLVRPNDLSRVDAAFFTMNGIASIVFGAFTVLSLLYGR